MNPTKTVILSISVPLPVAQALHDRKQRDALNVSAFCSRAIARELERPLVESEPVQMTPVAIQGNTGPVVLVAEKASA